MDVEIKVLSHFMTNIQGKVMSYDQLPTNSCITRAFLDSSLFRQFVT
jgi:hypothetical protein